MDQSNAFTYTGIISDTPKPLYKGDDQNKGLNGHTAPLAKMGQTIQFYIPASDVPDPKQGDEIIIQGELIDNGNGWAKCKVRKAKRVKEAKPATAAA